MDASHTETLLIVLYGLAAAFMLWVLWKFWQEERRWERAKSTVSLWRVIVRICSWLFGTGTREESPISAGLQEVYRASPAHRPSPPPIQLSQDRYRN